MTVFNIEFNHGELANQAMIMNRLRSEGYQVLQVSSGLLAKIEEGTKSIPETLGDMSYRVNVTLVDPNIAAMNTRFSKEARQFVGL